MDVSIVRHPLAQTRLTTMRDERTSNADFRRATSEIAQLLVYEACRDIAVETRPITTPVSQAAGVFLADPPLFVPILRAGLAMVEPALAMVPDAQVGFIGLARDEESHQPVPYLEAVPEDLSQTHVVVLDPMLATGGSLLHALRLLAERGAKRLTAVCIVAAPEGIAALERSGFEVKVVVATVDERLNGDAYIVPGLGDAGDRLYGPRYT